MRDGAGRSGGGEMRPYRKTRVVSAPADGGFLKEGDEGAGGG